MDWMLHAMIGGLVGFTVSLITEPDLRSGGIQNVLIGALAASLAGALWSPLCESFSLERAMRTLAPLWSMGLAMIAVIGNAELRRWP
ncbi:MAG: hypothetical protein HC933_15655 [Pleurocapsa sp. SU_196_0]|nr:hypothetical protein [Pleurocapsa sp. SU_196_0]